MSAFDSVRHRLRQTFLTPTIPNDNSWKGTELSTDNFTNRVPILFQNVRAFKFHKDGNTLQDLVHMQDCYGIDILYLSEHHQDTTKVRKQLKLTDIVQQAVPGQATCQFDSSGERNPLGTTKPGGTGIVTVGPMIGQLEPHGKSGDAMGRWSHMTFRRNGKTPVTVIAVYQVCKEPTNALGFTAWHQQRRALDLAGPSIHPRKAFIDNLIAVIQAFQAYQPIHG